MVDFVPMTTNAKRTTVAALYPQKWTVSIPEALHAAVPVPQVSNKDLR